MYTTVEDLMNLFIEPDAQVFGLYDINSGTYIYQGTMDDCPIELLEADVESIDLLTKTEILTINVDMPVVAQEYDE